MEYRPNSIVVTGGAGFIASWLVRDLIQRYKEIPVVVVDRLDSCSCPGNWGMRPVNWPKEPLKSEPDPGGRVTIFQELEGEECPQLYFYRVDIREEDRVIGILRKHAVDTILHLAAQTHVDDSFDSGHLYIEDNILGTHNLLRAVKEYGKIRRFVHCSTDEVQSGVEGIPVNETSFVVTNAYAATKAGAELMCRAFAASYQIPILITRCNNVYGPGHGSHPIKVIPKFITALLQGEKIPVHGTGKAKRNYIHVRDVVSAFLCIMRRGEVGQVYGIGTATEVSVLELSRRLISLVDPSRSETWEQFLNFLPDRPFQDPRYHVDVKALAALGWREETSFDQGLREVVEWYRSRTLHQIPQ